MLSFKFIGVLIAVRYGYNQSMQASKKKGSEDTNSKSNEGYQKGALKEELTFDIEIKRESRFIAKWKRRYCHIIYLPNQQLSLTIKNKDKGNQIEEIINLRNAKISKRCSIVEKHHCLGMEISSGKRYLIARETEVKTIVLFDNLVRLKRYFRETDPVDKHKLQQLQIGQSKVKKAIQSQLEFERSNQPQTSNPKSSKQLFNCNQSSHGSPFKTEPLKDYYYEQHLPQRPAMLEAQPEEDQDYRTVMQDQSIIPIQKEPQLHFKVPLSLQELNYLENDEGFKLRENFKEGRILQKSDGLLKANLLIKTHLNQFELLQSLFHLQLWNDRVQLFQVKNRIDEGIYLVYLQLKKKNLFSRAKYCYLMANALIIDTQPCLILKSLEESTFEPTSGYEWIDMTIWAKIRGTDIHNMQKFLTFCFKVTDSKNNEFAIGFMNQIKAYQSFLFTTARLPYQILSWRQAERGMASQ